LIIVVTPYSVCVDLSYHLKVLRHTMI